jgi:hypothetical protein
VCARQKGTRQEKREIVERKETTIETIMKQLNLEN